MSKVEQSYNQKNLAYYCECFSNLKVYKTQKKGDALNKPILLLSVIDLITQNVITDKNIYISDDLIETFKKYWHLKYSSEYEGGRPQSIPKIRDDVNYAFLDDELFSLIQDESTRKELIDALVSSWLSSDENEIGEILKINENFQNESLEQETITESTDTLKTIPKWSLKKTLIRNAFFRKAVVSVYDCQCAFCGLKVTKIGNQNIVDGAHIKPFSAFYDSRIHNGIALCKNHHWAFDRGWFAVDDKYKIIVSKELEEVSPHAKTMTEFHGEILILPKVEKYFPDIEALQWHRDHIFQP
ncbi:HNH endonuclease [Trichormus sp. NMC-1]|uniref:HNH endonuclease n=1 Tax=Trichormus sp. NMC-1 TaxID=1853259 RepID=UPI0008DC1AA9|nr:HNH endonuclease [Trichormus sp. NMC-1]